MYVRPKNRWAANRQMLGLALARARARGEADAAGGWRSALIYGTDLNGRRCVVAKVRIPRSFDHDAAVRYVRGITREELGGRLYRPYAVVAAQDIEFGER